MRIARKLMLLAAMAVAALALTASTASAQETPVEVVQEGGGHCNPCDVHVVGDSSLSLHLGGVEVPVSACTDEFEAEIYEDGSGHIYTYSNNHATDPDCILVKCNGVGEPQAETEWPVTDTGETAPGVGHLWVRFCLDQEDNVNATGTHCDVEVDVRQEGHHTIFQAVDEPCPDGTELNGEWETETTTHDTIEIIHL